MSNQPPFAEYPRPSFGQGGNGYGRGPGVYFEAIGEAWNLVKQDLGTWIAATIVFAAIVYGISIPVSLLTQSLMPTNANGADFVPKLITALVVQILFSIALAGVQQVLVVGMISMGVSKSRGEYINVGMIFEPFKNFGTIFLAGLLYTVIYYAATFACILPVFFFGPVLLLMPVVAYLKKVSPTQALSITYDACKAHWGGLLGLAIVSFLLAFAGTLACLVGLLFAVPVILVTYSIHYRAFFESSLDAHGYR